MKDLAKNGYSATEVPARYFKNWDLRAASFLRHGILQDLTIAKLLTEDISKQAQISVIQIQTPLNHGNSGGGLYSEKANLVGINTWIYEKAQTEGLNFSIAIDEFTKTLDPDLLKIITEK